MTANAQLTCENGCFEVTYTGSTDTDEDDRDFVDRIGLPSGVADGDCPNCGADVDLTWDDGMRPKGAAIGHGDDDD